MNRRENRETKSPSARFPSAMPSQSPLLTGDGYILLDTTGKLLDVNTGYSALVGYSRRELLTMTIKDLDAAFASREIEKKLADMLEQGSGRFQSLHRCKDGNTMTLASTFVVHRQDETPCIELCVRPAGDPRTERNAAPDEESLYHSLVRTAPDAVTVSDLNGNIIFVSERTLAFHKCTSPDEMLGKPAFDFIAPEDRQKAFENLKKTFDHGSTQNLEYTLLRKDGTRFIGELNASVVKDAKGKPTAFIATTRDITERKSADKALKDSEEKFRTLAEHSPNMIFINKAGSIVYVNRKCEEMMGYMKEELLSPEFDFRKLIAPDSRDSAEKALRSHGVGIEVEPFEYSLQTKDGKVIDAIITTKLIQYGGSPAILGVVTDISERKQVEQELHKTTHELRAEREALKEKNIALKQFLEVLEDERRNYRDAISQELHRAIQPVLRDVQKTSGTARGKKLALLEAKLKVILSRDASGFSDRLSALSPREMQVCRLIKSGMTSKQISEELNLSPLTVHKHREQIRKKLGITSSKINLTTYLQVH